MKQQKKSARKSWVCQKFIFQSVSKLKSAEPSWPCGTFTFKVIQKLTFSGGGGALGFLWQVAQNQVKVATDGSFCADTTFVQTPLKNFLFTLRLRSTYVKCTPDLFLYPSKKIGIIRYTDRIILKQKWIPRRSKNGAEIGLEYSDETFILVSNFFKNFYWCYDHVQGM